MAEESVFLKEPSVVWKTVITGEIVSPVFSLLGAAWVLELKFMRQVFIPPRFRVCLRRIGNEHPRAHFSVMTFIQTTDSVEGGSHFQSEGQKQTIIDDFATLVTIVIDSTSRDCFLIGTPVNVVCVFTDMPSTASGIPHEAVERMTQSDIECALSVKKIHALSPSSDECEQGSSILSRDLSKLLEDKVVSDVSLRCGDQTIVAHKAILAARSQVFSAMFQSRMLESETGVVDIADVDAQVLEMFLKYVYSGRLTDVPDESLPSLYAAGDKYAVGSLKTACSERMISNLTRDNCLNTLLLANAHSDHDFKNVIFNFILNHMEILKSEEWAKFCKENQSLSIEVFQTVVQQKCF